MIKNDLMLPATNKIMPMTFIGFGVETFYGLAGYQIFFRPTTSMSAPATASMPPVIGDQ